MLLLGVFGSMSKTFFFLNVWSRVILTIHPACHSGDGQPRVEPWLDVFKDKIAVVGVESFE